MYTASTEHGLIQSIISVTMAVPLAGFVLFSASFFHRSQTLEQLLPAPTMIRSCYDRIFQVLHSGVSGPPPFDFFLLFVGT